MGLAQKRWGDACATRTTAVITSARVRPCVWTWTAIANSVRRSVGPCVPPFMALFVAQHVPINVFCHVHTSRRPADALGDTQSWAALKPRLAEVRAFAEAPDHDDAADTVSNYHVSRWRPLDAALHGDILEFAPTIARGRWLGHVFQKAKRGPLWVFVS